jgi:hypothetical protein
MKTRTGFVSNSSSSSFIVAQKRKATYKLTDIFRVSENPECYSSETRITQVGKKAVVAGLEEERDDGREEGEEDEDGNEYWAKLFDQVNAVSDEYSVLSGWMDHCDETARKVMRLMEKNGDLIVIQICD